MIILSVLLIALLLLAASLSVYCVFKPRWAWLALVILTIVFGGTALIAGNVCESRITDLKVQAADLKLYYNLVNESYDEYVRFDFYEQVREYNAEYAACQKASKNPWVNAFYPKGWSEEIAPIEFVLRTDIVDNDYEDFYDGEVPDNEAVG